MGSLWRRFNYTLGRLLAACNAESATASCSSPIASNSGLD
jgi:hypothetical protein